MAKRILSVILSLAMALTVLIAPASAETGVYYTSDYASKAEALQAGLALNERIAEEGMTLVKNNGALPLNKGAKVSLFGYAGYYPNAGASMNGGDASAGAAIAQADVVSSLKDAGFALNPTLEETYKGVVAGTGATSDMDLMAAYIAVYPFWEASLAEYGDAALVTLGAGKGEVHNQQLDKVQLGMIDYVAEHFDTVIVLINTCTPIELKAIQDNEKVDAVLMIGEAGDNGFEAIGKILCGEVNPSGRTVDTWAADFTKAPSYMNTNINTENDAHSTDGNGQEVGYTQYTVDGELKNTWAVGYEEGIYIGYRYYETSAYEEAKAGNDGWFDENVVYTFGYGLSYTDFAWEITPVTAAGSAITKADTLEFDVKVTNTGDKAGRDVVELYYTAPFGTEETGNETVIEKAYVVLGDFAKTKPFEIAVKEGGAGGMMSSFNRIGMKWAGGSYPLLTSVLRDEWGFRGMVITDYSLNTYTHVDEMIRAGGDLFLTQETKTFNKDDDATQITLLRKATKNILYTVVNSNAMSVNIEGYLKPLWQEWMVYIDIALGALLVLWGVGIILATKKNPKPIQKKKAKA